MLLLLVVLYATNNARDTYIESRRVAVVPLIKN